MNRACRRVIADPALFAEVAAALAKWSAPELLRGLIK